MAFEADCGASTVLEALCVTSTPRFPIPEECRAPCHTRPRDEALRNSGPPTVGSGWRVKAGVAGWKIRNSKFEIRNSAGVGLSRRSPKGEAGWAAIPNSEFRIPNSGASGCQIGRVREKGPLFPCGNVGRVFAVAYPDRCRCVLNTPVFGGLRK